MTRSSANWDVFDSLSANIAVLDTEGTIVRVNEAWREFARHGGADDARTGPGMSYIAVCRDAVGRFSDGAHEALAGLESVFSNRVEEFEFEYPCPTPAEEHWYLVRATPLRPGPGIVVAHIDITAQKRAQQRLCVLEEVSKVVATSLDASSILRALGHYAVPRFADLFAADLWENGALRRVALVHLDPANEHGFIEIEMAGERKSESQGSRGAARVMHTKKAELMARPADILLEPPPALDTGKALSIRSAMSIPLVAHTDVLGAISFGTCNAFRVYDSDDLVFAENLAAHVALAIENARLYSAVRSADAAKGDFLALLAHELRNPMTPILNAVELLRLRNHRDARSNQALTIIEHQVVHQAKLLDDLLDLTVVDRGDIRLHREDVDFSAIVKETVEDHAGALASAGLALEVDVPGDACVVNADPTRLGQVVGNLLSNALKFTDRGGQVTVRVREDVASRSAELRIQDNGIGIEPRTLDSIFEPFHRVERTLARTRGGLGLGLALVRRLVALQGGEVRAESAGIGRGAEFIVRLPLVRPSGKRASVEGPEKRPGIAGLRVLIIEDNQDAANTLRELLEAGGHEALAIYSGPEGLAAVRRFRPDVVLCDIGLPGMDGYAIALAVRGDPDTAHVHMVAVTGYGQEADRTRARLAGFERQLTKPVRFSDVTRLLEEVQATPRRREERS